MLCRIFKNLFQQNRCLIPANSWFEWDYEKKPYLIKHKKNDIIAFAGLHRVEKNQERSFIIITAEAEKKLKQIHKTNCFCLFKAIFLKYNFGLSYSQLNDINSF